MPRWWYDRRLSRTVAAGVSLLGLVAFLTTRWTSARFALTSAFICFFVGILVAARARAWSVFYSDLALMLLVASIAHIIFTPTTWDF
jgi:predicted Co/Zn/Cd cation transporter (cation efflux family)